METVLATTANLTLRNLRESDFEAVRAYRSHPEVCRYIGEPMSAEQVAAHLERCKSGWSRKEGEALNLALELRGEGVVIGEGLVRYVSARNRQVEIGLALNPLRQSRGLGREACLALFRYCFEALGAHRVIGLVDVENEPSLRLSDSVGFRREGLLRHNAFRQGQWRDEHLVSLLEDEWPVLEGRFPHLLNAPR